MDIVALFSTDERLKLLQRAYFSNGARVTDLAAETGLSKGFVSLQLAELERQGIVKRKGNIFFPKDDPAVRILLIRSIMTDEFLKRHKAGGGAFANVGDDNPYDAWTDDNTTAAEIQKRLPGCKIMLSEKTMKDCVIFGGAR